MRRPGFIAIQGRHPHGLLGAVIARIMASETAADNKQAIALLDLKDRDHVLDVGTGHGRSLGVIAALAPQGQAVGVDDAETALRIARRSRRSLIRDGRVRVEHARSDALPFPDASFDKAMTVHTLYFWDPAEPHLREIGRVLKPGGKFVLAFRPAEDTLATGKFPSGVYTFRPSATVEALLHDAGFNVCRVRRRETPGNSMVWIVARKRLPNSHPRQP